MRLFLKIFFISTIAVLSIVPLSAHAENDDESNMNMGLTLTTDIDSLAEKNEREDENTRRKNHEEWQKKYIEKVRETRAQLQELKKTAQTAGDWTTYFNAQIEFLVFSIRFCSVNHWIIAKLLISKVALNDACA